MSFLRYGSREKTIKIYEERDSLWVAAQTSHISAHELTATVAPFQAWRNLQIVIARGPERATIAKRRDYSRFEYYLQALFQRTTSLFNASPTDQQNGVINSGYRNQYHHLKQH